MSKGARVVGIHGVRLGVAGSTYQASATPLFGCRIFDARLPAVTGACRTPNHEGLRAHDIFAHAVPQKNKEASTDHKPKQKAATHAWEVTPSRSATISILPLKAANRVASTASSG